MLVCQDCEKEKARHERLAFRPESAPTVLDMSPDGSRHSSSDGFHKHGKREPQPHETADRIPNSALIFTCSSSYCSLSLQLTFLGGVAYPGSGAFFDPWTREGKKIKIRDPV